MKRLCIAGRGSRRGMALIGVLVALALVTALLAAIGVHLMANRRLAEHRQHQLQAEWLARAGVELGIARLLTDPDGYTGETVEPIPSSRVSIRVKKESGAANHFDVVSEAIYPASSRDRVARSLKCRVRRVIDSGRVRIEVVPPAAPTK